MVADNRAVEKKMACPVCNGAGQVKESYHYQTQHKYDAGGQIIEHAETCWWCGGEGYISPRQQDEWREHEENPICPLCAGTGGRRIWSWKDGENGAYKAFSYTPCRVCNGQRHVTREQAAAFEREKQQLRFWGVGCTLLVVVVGIVGAIQLLTALLNGTPWFRCCPAPGLIPLGVILLQVSRRMMHGF